MFHVLCFMFYVSCSMFHVIFYCNFMRKLALIIMDGWGLGEQQPNNAIFMAETPFYDYLIKNYPHTRLQASGEYVGLPEGQIGGSEVGHLTIGAGRVLYQELPRITRSLTQLAGDESVLNLSSFRSLIQLARQLPIHIVGMVSTSGVHSHIDHLLALLDIMQEQRTMPPVIHFISDGRDTPPQSGIEFAKKISDHIREKKFGTIATLAGRFYSMDRDNNIDRTNKALDLLTSPTDDIHQKGSEDPFTMLEQAFGESYAKEVTDEFIEPVRIDKSFRGIQDGEPLFFFNFRADRMKQLITGLHHRLPSSPFITMTKYDKSYPYEVIFTKQSVTNTLGEVLSTHGLTQLRAAETEKFPHVTYFFNGGVEIVFEGEMRSLAESNKVKHDVMPEMKAAEIEHNVEHAVKTSQPDFILVNFANPDMVGHTGNFKAALKGVETVDAQLKKLCDILIAANYICCITADHGNADIMYDITTRQPHTAHTMNPVPFIIYDPHDKHNQQLKLDQNPDNGLNKIAGTVLQLMGVPKPSHDYESLIQ